MDRAAAKLPPRDRHQPRGARERCQRGDRHDRVPGDQRDAQHIVEGDRHRRDHHERVSPAAVGARERRERGEPARVPGRDERDAGKRDGEAERLAAAERLAKPHGPDRDDEHGDQRRDHGRDRRGRVRDPEGLRHLPHDDPQHAETGGLGQHPRRRQRAAAQHGEKEGGRDKVPQRGQRQRGKRPKAEFRQRHAAAPDHGQHHQHAHRSGQGARGWSDARVRRGNSCGRGRSPGAARRGLRARPGRSRARTRAARPRGPSAHSAPRAGWSRPGR